MQNSPRVYCDTLVQARELVIDYLKINNSGDVIKNDARRRVVRLSNDIHIWVETTCGNRIANWIKSEKNAGMCKYHFVALGRNSVAPYDEYCGRGVISEDGLIGLGHQVAQIISDWPHMQRADCSKTTSDHNMGLEDRLSLVILHVSEAKLAERVEEAYRDLLYTWADFIVSNEQEVSMRQQSGRFTARRAFLVIWNYFSAASICSLTNGDPRSIENA